jgi:release factor glutamine methyltransferase
MDQALLLLGRALREAGYSFVTPTPETIRRVNARAGNEVARDLRGVFGWSRPFGEGVLPAAMLALLDKAGALERVEASTAAWVEAAGEEARFRSAVRFSSLEGQLFVHSAWPTTAADAVFFGPDTYRYAALLLRSIARAGRVADVGCGSGAGGILLAPRAQRVVLSDVNPLALRYARVNAALARVEDLVEIVESDVLFAVEGPLDLVVSNPPYLADDRGRVYRDGGGPRGIDLSVRIAREALARLSPGGRLLLYTASPIEEGGDPLRAALQPLLAGTTSSYLELDPDVFGEELERSAYSGADRIAVVALDAVVDG